MPLTKRQTTFVERLVDLYHEAHAPIHYSALARRLGVSRFTAYDMLRLLEQKGLVKSNYQLSAGRSGPGRSEVLYQPTERARELVAQLAGPDSPEDWEAVKRRLVENFSGAQAGDRELTRAMLARVPPAGPAPIRYCLEVMTIVALRLKSRKQRAALARWLPALLCPPGGDQASLGLLGGWALGALAVEASSDEAWQREALAHLRRYHTLVMAMDSARCRVLSDGLLRIFEPLLRNAGAANAKSRRTAGQ